MDIAKSDLVLATAGREKGRLFFVVDVQNEYLLLADGKSRRLEAPKRKKCRHVQRVEPRRRNSPQSSEAARSLQTVSFVKPSPSIAASTVIKTRRDQHFGKIRHDRSGRHCR